MAAFLHTVFVQEDPFRDPIFRATHSNRCFVLDFVPLRNSCNERWLDRNRTKLHHS
jgi:hypothetical protein